jgi:uncharacterized protein YjiS (DUF1127 family)
MNAITYNKNAVFAAATLPAATAPRTMESRQESLTEILFRPFRRAKIARELRLLDQRMLSDIGLSPSDIDRIAAESVGGQGKWLVLSLIAYAGRKIAEWAHRRATYRGLMALDDRMLTDIGLSRSDIPDVVKAMHGPFAAQPVDGRFETEVVMPLKQWNLWRIAHKQLNQLDNRMLSDIGFVRGDIDWVADELATRAVNKPANANGVEPRAA